jgi:predicted dithiol-disulfide oxidoreductase (DUF899 family)
MFGPDYTAGCPSCSAIADGFNGFAVHLANHDVMLGAVSRAPLAKLQAYKRRMGWTFPWASSFGGDFNLDFNVRFTEEQQRDGGIEYNYRREEALQWRGDEGPVAEMAAMSGTDPATYTRERPGLSAFALEDGVVYHAGGTRSRGTKEIRREERRRQSFHSNPVQGGSPWLAWLAARNEFLTKEKEFTRLRDELSRQRRALPWEKGPCAGVEPSEVDGHTRGRAVGLRLHRRVARRHEDADPTRAARRAGPATSGWAIGPILPGPSTPSRSILCLSARSSSLCSQGSHLASKAPAQAVPLHFQIVAGLEVQPEALRHPEIAGQSQRCVCGDGPLAQDDLVDAARRDGNVFRQLVLADVHRLEEVLEKYVAGVNCWKLLRHLRPLS